MAMRKVVMFLVMMLGVWEACNGACSNLDVQKLKTCKDAVALSNPTDPSTGCCDMIKGLSSGEINCLCDYKRNDAFLLRSFGVDPDRCTQLPALCNLPNPIQC